MLINCPLCGRQSHQTCQLRFGNVRIDSLNIEFEGQAVSLARTQFVIVEALIRAKGRHLTREFLANSLGGEILDEAISQYIKRARVAFREIDPSFDQIETLRGFGAYRWRHVKDPMSYVIYSPSTRAALANQPQYSISRNPKLGQAHSFD